MRSTLALLVTGAAVNSALVHPSSSGTATRYTLNWGPTLEHATYRHGDSVPGGLSAFNLVYLHRLGDSLQSIRDPEQASLAVAKAFAKHLHPQAGFRVQSHYLSAHTNIYHVHLVQSLDGLDITNALVNVNVDLQTGEVLSYGDSAWKGTKRCDDQGHQTNQLVFSQEKQCEISYEPPRNKHLVEPKTALLTLLKLGNPTLPDNVLTQTYLDKEVDVKPAGDSYVEDRGYNTELHDVPGAEQPVPARLAYLLNERGELELTWQFEYQSHQNAYSAHVQASVNSAAEEPELLSIVDWVKDFKGGVLIAQAQKEVDDYKKDPVEKKPTREQENAIYRVFPWGTNDPLEGDRESIVDPANKQASPLGWHSIPAAKGQQGRGPVRWESDAGWSSKLRDGAAVNFTDTRGNNVFAGYNPTGGSAFELLRRPDSPSLNFTFPLGWGCKANNCTGKKIEPESYVNVSTTELFYTCNEIHDLVYTYGFDEAAGNFQERNPSGKGQGNDAVVAMAQDGSGYNNANFMTPPDGQRPRMRMYVWNGDLPWRDGSLEAGIVIHEYTHGISTRLTGGPANSDCLAWGEAGGMGEGWGDFFATLIRMHRKKVRDWTMGEYAAGRGIRKYPYSTNITHNPQTYKAVDRMWEVHAIGEVWAEVLFVVAEKLIIKYGFAQDLFPPTPLTDNSTVNDIAAHSEFYKTSASGKKYPAKGNTLALQLVIDGMKLQPCRPNFLSARDAIIAADKALTGGENYCTLMEGFAARGLGPNASIRGSTPWGGGFRTEDFTLPAKCKSLKSPK